MPFTLFETALGKCGLAWTDAGITSVALPEETSEKTRKRIARLSNDASETSPVDAPPWITETIARMRAHLDGRPQDLSSAPLDFSELSPFVSDVYRALRRVPAGRTTTYGDLATTVGSSGASRAVGTAMAKNPWPLLVPCHRVLGSKSSPGGFSAYGGLITKEKILAAEGASLTPTASLFASTEGTLPFDARKAVRELSEADTVLGKHIAKVGPLGLRLKTSEGTFAALAESIVYQQLHGKAAASIFGRLRDLYPGGRLDAARVLATENDKLRACGLSKNKLESLLDLARRSEAGTVPTLLELGRMEDEAIIERLTAVRGIGRWTVEMLLIFRLGRPDVFPVADYGIKKGFARIFTRGRATSDELPSAEAVSKRAERWRPYRSVASWYLWRATDS